MAVMARGEGRGIRGSGRFGWRLNWPDSPDPWLASLPGEEVEREVEREMVRAKRGLDSETAGIANLPRCARAQECARGADGTPWAPPARPAGPAVGSTAEARRLVTAWSTARHIRGSSSSKGKGSARTGARGAQTVLAALALTMIAVTASVIADEPAARAAAMGLAQAGVQVQAQAPATRGGQLVVQREAVEQDLVWLLAGIMDMDRDKKLALTRKQAADIWPTFKSLVDKGLIRLEVDPAQFEFGNRFGWQGPVPGQTQGQTQGQGGGPSQVDSARAQELRKQRQAREEALRQAIDDIEKTLSAKQLAYVDNFDFNPADYGLAPRLGGARPQVAQNQNQGQWSPPSQQEMQRLIKTARENAQKLADFYKKFQAFIQKKAGIKA